MRAVAFCLTFWILGLAVSLGVGSIVTRSFLQWLRKDIRSRAKKNKDRIESDEKLISPLYIENWLVGILERPFFTVLVAFYVPATAAAILTWIIVKLAINWSVLLKVSEPSVFLRSMGFSALFGNLFSMFFAVTGGLICRAGVLVLA
jgi:hypothetical protein